MELIKSLYFSIFVFGIIVLFDLLIKFKRPLLLKLYFSILTLSLIFTSFIHSVALDASEYFYIIILAKAFIASSFLNIFSTLYFPKFRIWVWCLSLVLISFTIFSYYYNSRYNPTYLSELKGQSIVIVRSYGLNVLPVFKIMRGILVASFFFTFVYFLYQLSLKFNLDNLYFKQIKNWTVSIFFLAINFLIMYLPIQLFTTNISAANYITIYIYFYVLLIIFYRPNFLNRSALKISLGEMFKKEESFDVNELNFINEFYTLQYFLNPEASMDDLAKKLGVQGNDLYRFVYFKYSMTFNDLVNQCRVEYFLDIIKVKKYQNYTIDALAKEVGFSSRQHFYKPFKKFHGGNPSDILEAMKGS